MDLAISNKNLLLAITVVISATIYGGRALVISTDEIPTVVVEGQGTLVGKTVIFQEDVFINVSKRIDMFLGVPFASPPERFTAPKPMSPWTGLWNATSFKPPCLQTDYYPYYPESSEDCLYLNVYAPSPKPNKSAVMVWIHGGGFNDGTAMTYDFYGVPLVAVGDVIIVTINYRLNIFSRFTTGDGEARGNYGMLDQVAALNWVHENIHEFGGDPTRITIFGESAGAASVNFHLLSPMSQGLFSQAIMQSGSATALWAFEHNPDNDRLKAERLGQEMGCDATNSSLLVDCLKSKNGSELMYTASSIYGSYQVILDGTFLLDTPSNLYEKGHFAHIPILAGFNKDEGTFALMSGAPESVGSPDPPFIPREIFDFFVSDLASLYSDSDIIRDSVFQEYADWTVEDNDVVDYFKPSVDIWGDSLFACPADKVLRKHAESDVIYKYFMTHAPSATSYFEVGDQREFTPWLDATHAEDLIFVFGMPFIDELADIHGHNLTDAEKAMSVTVMRLWTNFAKRGDPSITSDNYGQSIAWPTYRIPGLHYKELSLDFKDGRAARARQCHFWNEYLFDLAEATGNLDELEQEWRENYDTWKTDMTEWQREFREYQELPTCN